MYTTGYAIGIVGIALCLLLCGAGSAIGLFKTSSAVSGVVSENAKKFGGITMMLMLLPATQGLYGFVIAILAVPKLSALLSVSYELGVVAQGWAIFAACLPMALTGFISAFFQGRAAANSIHAVAKQDGLGFKIVMGPAMIEFYALLGFVISIMIISAIR